MIDIKSLEKDGLTWFIRPYRCSECFERGFEIGIFCDEVYIILTHINTVANGIAFINSAKKAGILNESNG